MPSSLTIADPRSVSTWLSALARSFQPFHLLLRMQSSYAEIALLRSEKEVVATSTKIVGDKSPQVIPVWDDY